MKPKFDIEDEVYFIDKCFTCTSTLKKGIIKAITVTQDKVTYKVEEKVNYITGTGTREVPYYITSTDGTYTTATFTGTIGRIPNEYMLDEEEVSASYEEFIKSLLEEEYERHIDKLITITKMKPVE